MEIKIWNEWLREHIQEVMKGIGVRSNQKVLDFGCGTGTYTIPIAKLVGKRGKVYALDKDEIALDELKTRARKEGISNIEIVFSSNFKTNFSEEKIDVVLLYDVIHQIEDWDGLFSEIHRILKPNGFVSVYPMHVDTQKIKRRMVKNFFSLMDEKYEGNIFHFEKQTAY